jgi:DHA1 family multidrug resistance protein-like MFS transporter
MVQTQPLALICLAELCVSMGMNLVNPLLPIYASSFAISYTMVGVVMSFFGITRLFVEVPGGLLTDKFGRRRIIVMGYLLSALAHLVAGVAQTAIDLTVSRMVMGVGSALSLTAGMAYVTELAPAGRRSRYIAIYQSIFSVSGIVGPTLGGLISEGAGLRALFLVSAAISVAGMGVALRLKPLLGGSVNDVRSHARVRLRDVIDRKMMTISLACFMMFFMFNSIRSTMIPLYGSDVLGLSSVQIGLVFSFTSAIIVGCLLFVNGVIEKRVKQSSLLTLSLLICAFAVYLFSLSVDFTTLLLVSLPFGLGFSLLQPTPFVMLSEYAKPEARGLMLGLARTIADVGIILGPTLAGWLIDAGQPLLVFYLVAASLSVFSLVTWRVYRTHRVS